MALEDHKRQGKKFLPPAKYLFNPGLTEVNYTEKILPEILWIGYFLKEFGIRKGIDISSHLIKTAFELSQGLKTPHFSFISSYRFLNNTQKRKCISKIKDQGLLQEIQHAILPFIRTYPKKNPLIFLLQTKKVTAPSNEDIARTKEVIWENHDRRAFDAVITQSVILYSLGLLGRVHYGPNVEPPDLESLVKDFESEEAGRAASHIRMFVSQCYMQSENEIGNEWANYFWNHGLDLETTTSNITPPSPVESTSDMHPFRVFSLNYERVAINFLNELWELIPKDILRCEQSEVIGALLSRQCNLSIKLAHNPDIWDWAVGPLLLRSMTDCHITLAWLLKNPALHSKQFISYGLGQEKLNLEHYKEALNTESDETDRTRLREMLEARESWLNSQHFSFLQEVDVGNWSGKTTRDMAMESDNSSLYRFAYTPYSNCAHNIWNHIGVFNSRPSDNPLHRFIREPNILETAFEPSVFMNSSKYLQKSYQEVVSHFSIKIKCELPYEWALDNINDLIEEIEKMSENEPPLQPEEGKG